MERIKRQNGNTYLSVVESPDTIDLGGSTAKLSDQFGGGDCASSAGESQDERGSRGNHYEILRIIIEKVMRVFFKLGPR